MNKKQLKKYDLLNLLTLCKSEEVAGAGEEESKLGIYLILVFFSKSQRIIFCEFYAECGYIYRVLLLG